MKTIFTILAIIGAILAIIFSVLPISNLAFFPAILALIFGGIAFYLSKKTGHIKKIIPFTLLLTAIALIITIYKSIFTKIEVTDTTKLDATETKLEEESINELDALEIEDIEIDDEELNNLDLN